MSSVSGGQLFCNALCVTLHRILPSLLLTLINADGTLYTSWDSHTRNSLKPIDLTTRFDSLKTTSSLSYRNKFRSGLHNVRRSSAWRVYVERANVLKINKHVHLFSPQNSPVDTSCSAQHLGGPFRRKPTVSFVLSVCPSSWNNSAPIGRILMKLKFD